MVLNFCNFLLNVNFHFIGLLLHGLKTVVAAKAFQQWQLIKQESGPYNREGYLSMHLSTFIEGKDKSTQLDNFYNRGVA